jgi:hypothetical protein
MSFTSTWNVVSSPDFDDDYLCMEVEPYVQLKQSGNRVDGEYHVGLQRGIIEGRLQDENCMVFSFEGMDELDPVNGAGTATVDGDRLTFTLMYHMGDDFTFECERQQ